MPEQHMTLVIEITDKIVSPDYRERRYPDFHILRMLVLLQTFREIVKLVAY